MHGDIVDLSLAQLAQQHGDPPVDKRFATDDAHIAVLDGLMHHMLAPPTKANLQPDGLVPPEQAGQVDGRAIRVLVPAHGTGGAQRRQVFVQIGLLAVTQPPLGLEATIEIAPGAPEGGWFFGRSSVMGAPMQRWRARVKRARPPPRRICAWHHSA